MYNEEFKKYQILCEQYYGKNNLLKEIDKAFDLFKIPGAVKGKILIDSEN